MRCLPYQWQLLSLPMAIALITNGDGLSVPMLIAFLTKNFRLTAGFKLSRRVKD
jgi:hypothetical protein